MPERILNVHTENWSEEPFAISRGVDDNFDVVVVELEQNGCKGWGGRLLRLSITMSQSPKLKPWSKIFAANLKME